jgi:hypothetical protein
MNHTPEPWKTHECFSDSGLIMGHALVDASGLRIADTIGADARRDVDDANASRIVACVNGCAGLAHPELVPSLVSNLRMLLEWGANRIQNGSDTDMLNHVAMIIASAEGTA